MSNWPQWHPKSVPVHLQGVLEDVLEGLVDGTFAMSSAHHKSGFGNPDVVLLELQDMRFPKIPWQANTTTTSSTAMKTNPQGVLTDLGVIREPVIGFRDFVLRTSIDGPILMSRNDHPWVYRKRMRALCASTNSAQPFSKHDAPNENCNCGIYAYSHPNDRNLQQKDVVWGEIAMWGDVLICPTGYRSQFAYPLNLFIRDNGTRNVHYLAEELQDLYGVPCFVVADREGKTAQQIMGEMIEEMLKPIQEDQ